jgi:hypothetical protein
VDSPAEPLAREDSIPLEFGLDDGGRRRYRGMRKDAWGVSGWEPQADKQESL